MELIIVILPTIDTFLFIQKRDKDVALSMKVKRIGVGEEPLEK